MENMSTENNITENEFKSAIKHHLSMADGDIHVK